MSDLKSENDKPAIKTIIEAWQCGRPIVPFFGAGVSVGAGFPLTAELREYFCKVLFYIRKGGYRLSLGQTISGQAAVSDPENNPSRYLATYGWPDFFRINAELLHIRAQMAIDEDVQSNNSRLSHWEKFLLESNIRKETYRFIKTNFDFDAPKIRRLLESLSKSDSMRPASGHRLKIEECIQGINALRIELENKKEDSWKPSDLIWVRGRKLLDRNISLEFDDLTSLFRGEIPDPKKGENVPKRVLSKAQQIEKLDKIRKYLRILCYAEESVSGWGNGDHWLGAIVESEILEIMRLEDSERVNLLEPEVWSRRLTNRIDWFRLLLELVEGRMGLADLLFATLNRDRIPSAGHITIAHLASRMGWPLILTLNHDTLLEEAFRNEKLPHKVFDVSKDANVPDRVVVTSELLSIVKLHGSAFGLKLGEPTNLELDTQTKLEIQQYIPPRALIVVAGFSGYERRMMSLIESFCLSKDAIEGTQKMDSPRIVWLHQETKANLPQPIKTLESKLSQVSPNGKPETSPRMVKSQIQDAGRFFLGLYQSLTNKLPRTRYSYEALPKRIFLDSPVETKDGEAKGTNLQHIEYPDATDGKQGSSLEKDGVVRRHLFYRPLNEGDQRDENSLRLFENLEGYLSYFETKARANTNNSPSLKMSQFVQRNLTNFRVIWVDLEDHHTISGIVTEIADRMRIHDPSIPPLLLPVEQSECHASSLHLATESVNAERRFSRAVRYLKRYLRRGRYAIIFDSIEGFGRNHLSHHGLVRFKQSKDLDIIQIPAYLRINDLMMFLREMLIGSGNKSNSLASDCRMQEPEDIGGSIICASMDVPTSRHMQNENDNYLLKLVKEQCTIPLVGVFKGDPTTPFTSSPKATVPESSKTSGERSFELEDLFDFGASKLLSQSIAKCCHKQADSDSGLKLAIQFILFQIMVTFRRPRSLTSIHWVINRYFAILRENQNKNDPSREFCDEKSEVQKESVTEDDGNVRLIEEALLQLEDKKLIFSMEGGYYWVEHSTHEAAYEILTKPLWESALSSLTDQAWNAETNKSKQAKLRESFRSSFASDLVACLTVVAWNSMISRFYYVHSFQRSADVNALFEYIYHRVSALRYMQIARGLVARHIAALEDAVETGAIPTTFEDDCMVALNTCLAVLYNSLLSDLDDKDRRNHDCGSLSERIKSVEGLNWILHLIDKSRSRYLRTLINVVERESQVIFRTASADSWLNWVASLEDGIDDIAKEPKKDDRRWASFISVPRQSQNAGGMDTNANVSVHDELLRLRYELQLLLLDIRSRLHREKGSYDECKKCRERMLDLLDSTKKWRDIKPEGNAGKGGTILAIEVAPFVEDRLRLAEFIYNTSVDLISCWRRDQGWRIGSDKYLRVHGSDCRTECIVKEKWESYQKPEDAIFAYSMLPDLFKDSSGKRIRWGSLMRTRIHLEWLRMQIDDLDPWVGKKHSLLEHKADLAMIESRIYGSAFRKESEFSVVLAELFGLRGQIQMLSGEYKEAMSSLLEALSGLSEDDETQQFHIAAIRRRYAHCLMQIADGSLEVEDTTPSEIEDDSKVIAKLDFAISRLKEASLEISDVERMLRRGRRNVRAWKHLYRAKVQLSIEYLLCHIQRYQLKNVSADAIEMFPGVIRTHMETALDGIRGGLDCSLRHELVGTDGADAQIAIETEDLVAKWLILFALGSICYKLETKEAMTASPYLKRWESVNESSGIHRLTNAWRTTNVQWKAKPQVAIQGTNYNSEIPYKETLNKATLRRFWEEDGKLQSNEISSKSKQSGEKQPEKEQTIVQTIVEQGLGRKKVKRMMEGIVSRKFSIEGKEQPQTAVEILRDQLLGATPIQSKAT